MKADQVIDYFNRICDAPEAIPRLRRFILDLAVRGKLVEQNPNDEPASELLKRIEDDVRDRKASGEFREPRNALEVPLESLPFKVPPSWRWVSLVRIADVSYGFAFESSRFNSLKVGMPLIRIRDISDTDTEAYYDGDFDEAYVVHRGDYLVGMDGDFNVRKWSGPDALLNQRVMRIKNWRAGLVGEFVAIPLQIILNHLHVSTSQTTVKHLSAKQVNGIYLPLPGLPEQHRIVTKVDELMVLCDRLETAQGDRERQRDKLATGSLQRLNNRVDADQFREHARFHLRHLPRLTTRPEHIQQLRQTILNLAVRGRLVPQEPNESALSFGIDEDAQQENRLQLRLPRGWSWARVKHVAEARLGKMLDKAKNAGQLHRYLRNTNVHWFDIRMDELKDLRIEKTEVEKYLLLDGDVLICEGGHGIGRTAVWRLKETGIVFQKALHRIRPGPALNSEFFTYCVFVYFHSGVLQTYFTGVGIPHFTGQALSALVFPLPPRTEQDRIVAKATQLLALSDRLEAQLTTSQTKSRQLLEAVLQEALNGAPART